MPVDNAIYDRLADTWWDEKGSLNALTVLNPVRFRYFCDVLLNKLSVNPRGKDFLDIGCGGGLLAEEFARLGCNIVGIDPSIASIRVAARHSRGDKLSIDYIVAAGEEVPFKDESFDVIYCCDTLEHVNNLDQVIAETSRVLKKGAIYFYETINRTLVSKIIAIELLQKWAGLIPPNTHDWKMFIKPEELYEIMARHGIKNRGIAGQVPASGLIRLLGTLRRRMRGEITWAQTRRQLNLKPGSYTGLVYMGFGVKS